MTVSLAQTALHPWRLEQGVKMVDFAGWAMPIQYSSIIKEHLAVRGAVGLFDVSHMARFRFDGPEAPALLDRILTRGVGKLKPGQIRYSLVTNDEGGILDDVLIYLLQKNDPRKNGGTFFLMVANADNRRKIADWIAAHTQTGEQTGFSDQTEETAMIAVQGPRALETAQTLFDEQQIDLKAMRYYTGRQATLCEREGLAACDCIVSRTGYTGEDGCELIVPGQHAVALWRSLLEIGAPHGVVPAGLGARDTLRLEAAMPLYGHELTEKIDPYQAGLSFAVNLDGREFIGKQALAKLSEEKDRPVRIGLEVSGKRAARENYRIIGEKEPVGQVTSGAYSPTFERPIAMGYVAPQWAKAGTELTVDIRGTATPAQVVELPFYKRK